MSFAIGVHRVLKFWDSTLFFPMISLSPSARSSCARTFHDPNPGSSVSLKILEDGHRDNDVDGIMIFAIVDEC